MAIDSSIALQSKLPTFDNPLTQYAQVSAIQNAQNQNQLAQYTISKAQRSDADELAQRNLLTGAGGDLDAGYNALLKGGYLDKAMAIKKAQIEQQKAQADVGHVNAQTGEIGNKVASKQHEAIGQTLGSLSEIPTGATPQHVTNAMQHLVDIGMIKPEMAQKIVAGIPQDPAEMKTWLVTGRNAVMGAKDQRGFVQADANTVANNTQSGANNAATVAASRDNNTATVNASIRNTDAKIDAEKPPAGYRYNATGNLEAIPGGPAAGKPSEQQKTVNDANGVLGLLDMAEPLLKKATSSYIGAGADKVAQAFGASTEGAQASAQLKALEGSLVSKMPKMSGPQSDKDVLLYRQMAGQIGDATIPVETRQAAIKVIRELNQKYVKDNGGRYVVRTGMKGSQKVVQYSDGSIEVAN